MAVESGSDRPSSASRASLNSVAPSRSCPVNIAPTPMNAFGIAFAAGSPSSTPICSACSSACRSRGLVSMDSPLTRRMNATQKYASPSSRRSACSPAASMARELEVHRDDTGQLATAVGVDLEYRLGRELVQRAAILLEQ